MMSGDCWQCEVRHEISLSRKKTFACPVLWLSILAFALEESLFWKFKILIKLLIAKIIFLNVNLSRFFAMVAKAG